MKSGFRSAPGLDGMPAVIGHGLVPFLVLAAAVLGFRLVLRKKLKATREDADQAVFVLLAVAFAIMTVTGVLVPRRGHGPGLALVDLQNGELRA